MKKSLVIFTVTLLSVVLPLKAKAASLDNRFTNLYVFGDSLSDTGNIFGATQGILPPFPYVDGRFSNGDNWIDYLATDLGLSSPTPLVDLLAGTPPTNGVNFAFGGATTGLENTLNDGFLGVQEQIGAFNSLPAFDPDGLYIVWAGANDYLPNQGTFTPYDTPQQTVTNLASSIAALAGLGAKNFLVPNLPDLGDTPRVLGTDPRFPFVPGLSPQLNALTRSHNQQLSNSLNALRPTLNADVKLIEFDINSLFEDVTSNPSEYGFNNITDPCIFSGNCAFAPDQQEEYFFWDDVHPTTRGHQIIANYALQDLAREYAQPKPERVPEPTSLLGIVAVGVLCAGGAIRRARPSIH
jgi:phospholipase/lecithinase/hemolysin